MTSQHSHNIADLIVVLSVVISLCVFFFSGSLIFIMSDE